MLEILWFNRRKPEQKDKNLLIFSIEDMNVVLVVILDSLELIICFGYFEAEWFLEGNHINRVITIIKKHQVLQFHVLHHLLQLLFRQLKIFVDFLWLFHRTQN